MKEEKVKLLATLLLVLMVDVQRIGTAAGGIAAILSMLEQMNTIHDAYLKFTTASTDDIMDKTEELSKSLDNWGANIEAKIEQSMNKLLTRIPLLGEIAGDVRALNDHVGRLDKLYSEMKYYIQYPDQFTNRSLGNLLNAFTGEGGDSVEGTINGLFSLVVPQRLAKLKKSLFQLLAQETQVMGAELCDTGATPQQRLIDFYTILMESELKASAMMNFGFAIMGARDNVNFTPDINRCQYEYTLRAKDYLQLLRRTIPLANKQFRRCDPKEGRIRDKTAYEFVKFVQGYLVQETVLHKKQWCSPQSNNHCERFMGGRVMEGFFNGCTGFGCGGGDPKCTGRLFDCGTFDQHVDICVKEASNARRYDWFFDRHNNSASGNNLDGCDGEMRDAGDYYEGGSSGDICEVCRCKCIEDRPRSKSIHWFSLRQILSDVENNNVITGVAFKIINGIAQLQIQQGQAALTAAIVENSTSWKPVENITRNMDKPYDFAFVKNLESGETEALVTDQDIAILTYEDRRIHLDDLVLPDGYMLTGIQFHRRTDRPHNAIEMQIRGTSFNEKTGELNSDTHIWITPDMMQYTRDTDRSLYDTDASMRNPFDSKVTTIDTKPYSAIDFTTTSWKWDAAQTVVPLLDALTVTSDPPVPLTGIGLFHKSEPGYGGLLTFRLTGKDISPYLPTEP